MAPVPAKVLMMPVGVTMRTRLLSGIGDVDVAGGIDGQALRRVQLGVDGGAAIAREAGARVAGHQRERAAGVILKTELPLLK